MAKAFWPGYRWRTLAHKTTGVGRAGVYHRDHTVAVRSWVDFDCPVEFDELGIDDWFHLEQMSERDYWIGVGNPNGGGYWHVRVHIDGKGKATVRMEKQ